MGIRQFRCSKCHCAIIFSSVLNLILVIRFAESLFIFYDKGIETKYLSPGSRMYVKHQYKMNVEDN